MHIQAFKRHLLPHQSRTILNKPFFENQQFDSIDFTQKPLALGEYEHCQFVNCNFSDVNLSHFRFAESVFEGCNLSLVKLGDTAFQDIKFTNCKLLGLRFDHCNPFLLNMRFDNCLLNLSSFYKLKLTKTVWANCQLHEVDFTEADCSQAVFKQCDFAKSIFDHSILEKADLRSSFNYSIDPTKNRIKKAKFGVAGIAGLLDQLDIVIE
jgi:fluoroquinolone resistance protein